MNALHEQHFRDGQPARGSEARRGNRQLQFIGGQSEGRGGAAFTASGRALHVALLRRCRLRWKRVEEVITRKGRSADRRNVLIYRIRRKFRDGGAEDHSERQGYRLISITHRGLAST
jgi:hypothetical protein